MAIFREVDGSDPVRIEPVERLAKIREERGDARSWLLGHGTLACPRCDAPVAPLEPLAPMAGLGCPVCRHRGAVRDFLSLGEPTRPARVAIRLVRPARAGA